MDFAILNIVDLNDAATALVPAAGDESDTIELEPADCTNVLELSATNLKVWALR